MKQTQPFLYVPHENMDQTLYIVLQRFSYYLKAMEESLVRSGVTGFREVEKLAMRNEAMTALDQINEKFEMVKQAIEQEWDPDRRAQMQAEWDTSDQGRLLAEARQRYKDQLAEALNDSIL